MDTQLYPTGNAKEAVLLECTCSCGKTVWVDMRRFLAGHTQSCGCRVRETARKLSATHGMSRTRTYKQWIGMRRRCYSLNHDSYPNYGGRGITVCKSWRASFEAFLLDMGECPSDLHSIERVDNDGNYEPGNCLWATALVQQNNRRNNRMIPFRDKTYTMANLARATGVPRYTIKNWLYQQRIPDSMIENMILARLSAADAIAPGNLSTGELANELNVSRGAIIKWARQKKIVPDFTTAGGHHRWDATKVKEQLRALRETGE